ncbi:hypothetical protein TEA_028794 [Camellia sinensis var. sinensis]|uniref:F-box domain-containing protein n=1 Tax=Camellia sinensis var. sinensis TaxID=542762 RepID=A0A4S4F204_CAMSN|nr:hypothetical protein TEA_028794 [Camellia sinensis var. sinensis]
MAMPMPMPMPSTGNYRMRSRRRRKRDTSTFLSSSSSSAGSSPQLDETHLSLSLSSADFIHTHRRCCLLIIASDRQLQWWKRMAVVVLVEEKNKRRDLKDFELIKARSEAPSEPVEQGKWANLPSELLLDIIQRVEESETTWPARTDVVFCASVCKSWRDITKEIVKTPEECGRLTFPISLKQVTFVHIFKDYIPAKYHSLYEQYLKRSDNAVAM